MFLTVKAINMVNFLRLMKTNEPIGVNFVKILSKLTDKRKPTKLPSETSIYDKPIISECFCSREWL